MSSNGSVIKFGVEIANKMRKLTFSVFTHPVWGLPIKRERHDEAAASMSAESAARALSLGSARAPEFRVKTRTCTIDPQVESLT